jgi:hypothetical protein
VGKAINDGFLNGEIKKDKWSPSIHITEQQKKLQQFIIRNDKTLFPETKYLEKLHTPDTPVRQEMSMVDPVYCPEFHPSSCLER